MPIQSISTETLSNPGTSVPSTTVALSPANPTTTSSSPTVHVTVPNTTGVLMFELVVTDSQGNKSAPAAVQVEIQASTPPVAELTATPVVASVGAVITLNAAGSSAAAPGTIASYTFTLMAPNTSEANIEGAEAATASAVVSNLKS
jgi:hypothetical protein